MDFFGFLYNARVFVKILKALRPSQAPNKKFIIRPYFIEKYLIYSVVN